VITWQVVYDSQPSNFMRLFSDGIDGAANRGGGDDQLNSFICLDTLQDSRCTQTFAPTDGFYALRDVNSSVEHVRLALLASLGSSRTAFNFWSTNTDTRTSRVVPWGDLEQVYYAADDFYYSADNYPFRCVFDCPNTGNATFGLAFISASGDIDLMSVLLTRVSHTAQVTEVSEPGSLPLSAMPIALLVIAASMRRRN
jgi:hypothetical protein